MRYSSFWRAFSTQQQRNRHGPFVRARHVACARKTSSAYGIHRPRSRILDYSTGGGPSTIPVDNLCRICHLRTPEWRSRLRTMYCSQSKEVAATAEICKGKGKGKRELDWEEEEKGFLPSKFQFFMLQTACAGWLREDYPFIRTIRWI